MPWARLKEELRPAAAMIMPTMVQVGAIDPHGIAMWSTALLPDRPLDLSRTDYVQAIATGRLDHYISAPAMGTLSHRMSIHFADAVREPDGSLCAMTVVSLDISQINTLARGLEPSGQNFVAVLRDDGMVLGQSDGRGIGTNLSRLRPSLPQLLTEENSQARGASQVDGVRRFLVRRAVPGSGTAVVVGLDEAEMLARHGRRRLPCGVGTCWWMSASRPSQRSCCACSMRVRARVTSGCGMPGTGRRRRSCARSPTKRST